MDKAKINYCVDILLGISFAVVLFTVIMRLLSLANRNIMQIHKIAGIAMLIFGLIHVILHFQIFVNMTKIRFSKK